MARIAFIGFGEAGATFAAAMPRDGAILAAYDSKTDDAATREGKREDYARAGVSGCDDLAIALSGATAVFSLVTADAALSVAEAAAPLLAEGMLYLDGNSVAPSTKRAAAAAVEAAGGRYVDLAIMAPVQPARAKVPLLTGGLHAADAATLLARLGFLNIRTVPGDVGRASSIKMIRSVMVKGIEALTAECVLAAEAAGVRDEVLASLDASPAPADWTTRADYNLDRMMVHGLRRAAEMEEVARTLADLGHAPEMTRGTILRQRALGSLGLAPPPGLDAKLAALTQPKDTAA